MRGSYTHLPYMPLLTLSLSPYLPCLDGPAEYPQNPAPAHASDGSQLSIILQQTLGRMTWWGLAFSVAAVLWCAAPSIIYTLKIVSAACNTRTFANRTQHKNLCQPESI